MRNYAGDAASYPTNTQLPNDGDDANAATFDAALKPLADRTAYLKAFKDLVESDGVGRIRTASSFAAIETLTGMAEGDLVLLPAYGLYRYEPTVAPAAVPYGLPWVIAPTTAAPGVWVNVSTMLTDIGGGTAAKLAVTLDSAGKVPKAKTYQPKYEIVDVYDVMTTAAERLVRLQLDASASSVMTDALRAGDLLQATWSGTIVPDTEASILRVSLAVEHGTVTDLDWLGSPMAAGTTRQTVTAPRITLPTAAYYTVRLCVGQSGAYAEIQKDAALTVTVLRRT